MGALLDSMLEHSAAVSAEAHTEGMRLLLSIAAGTKQGLDVVQTTTIQAQASVSDDPGLIAALQTASRAPVQGSNDLPK